MVAPAIEAAAINSTASTLNNVADKTGLSGYIGNKFSYARNNKRYFLQALRNVGTLVRTASQLLDDCPADGGFDNISSDWLDRVKQIISDFKSSGIAKEIPDEWTGVGENIRLFSDNNRCKPEGYIPVDPAKANWLEHVHRARLTKFKAPRIGEKSKEFLDRAEVLQREHDGNFKESYKSHTFYKKQPRPDLQDQTEEMYTLVRTASQLLDQCPKDRGFDETSFDWLQRVMQLIDKFEASNIVVEIPAPWSSARENIRQFWANGRYKPEAYTAAPSAATSQQLVRRNGVPDYEIKEKSNKLASEAKTLVKEYEEKLKKDFDGNTLYKNKPCPELPAQTKMTTLVSTASELLDDCPLGSGFDVQPFDWLHQVMNLIKDFESSEIATNIPDAWSEVRENINQFSRNSMYKPEEYARVEHVQIYQALLRNPIATDKGIEEKLERLSSQAEGLIKVYDGELKEKHREKTLFKKRPRCQLPDGNNGIQFMDFDGRKETMKKVLRSINGIKPQITLIYGPGGIGKTTILAEVAKKAQQHNMFGRVVYAEVKRRPNVCAIQYTIASQLGMSLQLEGQIGRSSKLENNIKQNKKVLVILDDVWGDDEIMTRIGIPFIESVKVLVGTRRRDLAWRGANKIPIDLLSPEDSWKLLEQEAQVDGYNIKIIAEQVQAECCGLPLALAVIGKALSQKDVGEWKRAVHYLKNSDPTGLEDVEHKLYKIISFSFDNLPNEITRNVFLSCCLFPESEKVHEVDLQRHLDEDKDMKILDAEVSGDLGTRVVESVDTLEHYGLLQKCSTPRGIVKMHDVVRDVAVFIAREKNYASIICGAARPKNLFNKKNTENCTRMSLSNINEIDDTSKCPELQTLLIRGNTFLPDLFFSPGHFLPDLFSTKSKHSLAVLDLSHSEISTLPTSLGNLTNVRTLLLNGCKNLSDVAVIVKLTGLQVLSLRESVVKSLPKNMKNLLNLIVLDWENSTASPREGTDPEVTQEHIKGICKLKELSMKSKSITDGAFLEITKLKHLRAVKLYVTKKAISSAGIFAGENPCTWNKFTIYNHFDSLMLSETKNFNLSIKGLEEVTHGFRVLLRKAEEVVIDDCFQNATRFEQSTNGGTETGLVLTEATGEGTLKNTSILRVTDCANISYLTSEDGVALTELEEMELKGLKILIGIFKPQECTATGIFLGKVRKITVTRCDEIKCVIPMDVLQSVQNTLEVISVIDSKKVECIFQLEANCSAFFSKLTSIVLYNLEMLNCIWQGTPPVEIFKCLKELSVKKCNMLTSLFTVEVAEKFKKLQKLTVEDNSGLTEIISTDGADAELSKQAFPSVTHLSLRSLPNLKHFNSSDINFEWPALIKLKLGACPTLTGLPIGPGSAPRMNIIDLDSSGDLEWYKKLKNQERLKDFETWVNTQQWEACFVNNTSSSRNT